MLYCHNVIWLSISASTYCMLPKGHEKLDIKCSMHKMTEQEEQAVLFQLGRREDIEQPDRLLCGVKVTLSIEAPKDRVVLHPEVLAKMEEHCTRPLTKIPE